MLSIVGLGLTEERAAGFVNDLAIGWAEGARSAVKWYVEFSPFAFTQSLLEND